MTDRPIIAVIFSLIGGICVAASGFVLYFFGTLLSYLITGSLIAGIDPVFGYVFEIIFGLIGAVMIIGSVMMYRQKSTRKWGAITMVMGAIAFAGTALTIIGGILAIIGGVLALQLNFLSQSARTLKLAVKPGRDEVWLSIKISALGIVIIGLIGFIIKYLAFALTQGA